MQLSNNKNQSAFAASSTPLRAAKAASRLVLAGAGLAILLSGCASLSPKTTEEVVAQRANERWNLMRADKFEPSYEYTAPSYRAVKDAKSYRTLYGPAASWTDAKVAKVECSSEAACNVVMEVTVKNVSPMRSVPTLTTAIDESWVKEGDRWYFLPRL